jgi:small conductance mechanosensitive channel
MNEIVNKYVAKYAELVIPWVLTSGVKIIFIIIGTLILNKIIAGFIQKRCESRSDLMEYRPKKQKKKRKYINPNFNTTARIGLLIIASLMILEEFGVEIAHFGCSWNSRFGFWFWRTIPSEILYRVSFIILENQYRVEIL